MSVIQNLVSRDAFGEAEKEDNSSHVHIRIQQRNGRKTLTTIQGLAEEYDKQKIVKVCKKEFACNGTIVAHPEYGQVIQLQGDQRTHISKLLLDTGLCKKEQIHVHGF